MPETKDLILKPGAPDDWEALYQNIRTHESAVPYLFGEPCTAQMAAAQKTAVSPEMRREAKTEFFIYEKRSHQAIGIAGIKELQPGVFTVTEMALGPDFSSRDYGKQILTALLHLAFDELGARELRCHCFPGNIASQQLARSCGFRFYQTERTEPQKNGEAVPLDCYRVRRVRNILCFGDSNTYGYDPRSYLGGRYPAEVRWTDRLAQGTGCTVINAGMNGRTIPSVCPAQWPQADLLLVMLGSNDLLQGLSPQEVTARMDRFLTGLLPLDQNILLVAPPPMQRGDWVAEERLLTDSAQLAARYQALARRLDIHFADAGQWGVELTFDGVHFSAAGHLAFAEGVSAALKRYFL